MEVRNSPKADSNVYVSETITAPTRCSTEASVLGSTTDDRKVQSQCNADSGYHSWGSMESSATSVCHAQSQCSKLTTTSATCFSQTAGYTSVCTCCMKGQASKSTNSLCKEVTSSYQRDSMHLHRPHHYDSNGNVVSQLPVGAKTYEQDVMSSRGTCKTPVCYVNASLTGTISSGHTSHSGGYAYDESQLSSNSDLKSPNEKLEAEAQDLAVKIEFCLKFGFSAPQVFENTLSSLTDRHVQYIFRCWLDNEMGVRCPAEAFISIRAAITKLSYKATKNDIITELVNGSTPESGSGTLISHGPPSLALSVVENTFQGATPSRINEKHSNLVGKGISNSLETSQILQSRGPLTTQIENEAQESAKPEEDDSQNLRPIVIDGSNVAMSHGNKQYFSCKGILLAVDYFRTRNHRDITVFIPQYRKESPRPDAPIREREILDRLERERILVYTPSRCINGKRVTCYDDRFILRLAEETDGVIVSNDNFRDLQTEKQQWKELIEKRLLMYSFVNDRFMPPDDPLGRNGPSIDNFLRKRPASEEQSKPQCPYGKRCTYGKKCKYFHPECSFSQKSVTEQIKEKSEKRMKASSEAKTLAAELVHVEPPQPVSNKEGRNAQVDIGTNSDLAIHNGQKQPPAKESPEATELGVHTPSHSQRQVNVCHPQHPRSPNSGNSYVDPYAGLGITYMHQGHVLGAHEQSHSAAHQYQQTHDSLSNSFRQNLNVSNSSPGSGPYGPLHPRHQADPPRLHSPHPSFTNQHYVPPQQAPYRTGPPDMHSNTGRNTVAQNMQPRPYQQHSSPPGFQIFESSGGVPMMPSQHMNLSGRYQTMPTHHPQYGVPPQNIYPHINYHHEAPYPNHPQHVLYQFSGAPAPYVHSYVSPSSQGSGSSLSRSYPAVPSAEQQRSLTSDPDPKTYPPPRSGGARRGHPYPGNESLHHVPDSSGSHSLSYHTTDAPPPPASRMPADQSLVSPQNPRHNLFKNLCGLFPRVTVERVMLSHPELSEPKKLIKLCLGESDS